MNMDAMPASWQRRMVRFCRRMVQTPSLSGQEGDIAALIRAEMEHLRYDDVWVDEVGNVIGAMKGASGPSVMLNCHMDQVDAGDPDEWPYGPFSARVADETIWGRGASDTKGAIAAQVYAVGLMKAEGRAFPGDTYVTCVVHEETGSWGTQFLLGCLKTDVGILGEATANHIAHGHRGRTEVIVHLRGRAAHASVASPETNPLFALAAFLRRMRSLALPEDPTLGPAMLTPTRCYTDQESGNMTPDHARLHLDWRSLPEDKAAVLPSGGGGAHGLLNELRAVLEESCPSGVTGTVELLVQDVRSYTGLETSLPASAPSYLLDPHRPPVSSAQEILEEHLARSVTVAPWGFATDGGYMVEAGIPTIGFSPCEQQYAHTIQDQVRIDLMIEAVRGNMALVAELPRRLA
ncbi:MAG: M20/M25/M40 family metallo-hydrolase [Anaerolineae bacterium]|jgi:putative selenium metabolism hydrolase